MFKIVKNCEGCKHANGCTDEFIMNTGLELLNPLLDKAGVEIKVRFALAPDQEDGLHRHEITIEPREFEPLIARLHHVLREDYSRFLEGKQIEQALAMLERQAAGGSVQ